jgi:DNA-binding response OmpR family regulator
MSASSLNTILLVEDDPDIQELAVMSLAAVGGFEVHACDNGRLALQDAARVRPDLIILDWMMPGLDGGETLALLRRDPDLAGIPVIFMTAKVRPEEIDRMRALGALDVIGKPFDPMELANQVRAIWSRPR